MTDGDRGPYHNMSASQKAFFDYIEKNGPSGSKRYAKEGVGKWQENRANMTAEEIAEMEAALEHKSSLMSKVFLGIVAMAFIAAVVVCVMIVG